VLDGDPAPLSPRKGAQQRPPFSPTSIVSNGGPLVSPDGVAPSRLVDVSASVNLPLHHKVQKFSSGTGVLKMQDVKTQDVKISSVRD